jgi:hypothetical protein
MSWAARTVMVLLACVLVLPAWSASEDPDYLPLSTGRTWVYESPVGGGETMTVVGTRDLMGTVVWVMDYTESTVNDSLENYWTTGADGDVLLHGFVREDEGGWGVVYLPPIAALDVPVFVGKSWQCSTQTYRLPEETPWDDLEMGFEVVWEGVLSVPAGEFPCIGVANVPVVWHDSRRGYTLDGRKLSRDSDPWTWYSGGVGVVRYDADRIYDLISYGVTPVESASWTRIKALYH